MRSSKPLRRSGRAKVPTKKYDEAALRVFDEDHNSNGPEADLVAGEQDADVIALDTQASNKKGSPTSGTPHNRGQTSDEDDEYEADVHATEATDSASDESLDDEGLVPPGPRRIKSQNTAVKRTVSGISKTEVNRNAEPTSHKSRNRGLPSHTKARDPPRFIRELVGTDEKDVDQLIATLGPWLSDPVVPSRTNLDASANHYKDHTASNGPDGNRVNALEWYSWHGGSARMQQAQEAQTVPTDDAPTYYPQRHPQHKVVMGPVWKQSLFTLALDTALHLADTWAPARSSDAPTKSVYERDGWILNLGARVQCLAWAPSILDNTQHLAVSLWNPGPSEERARNAFDPAPPYNASIQIWAFYGLGTESSCSRMDPDKRPALVHVLCAKWGMCVDMQWCPRAGSAEGQEAQPEEVLLGPLATVWTDGYVRVLNMRIPKTHKKGLTHGMAVSWLVPRTALMIHQFCTTAPPLPQNRLIQW